MYQPLIYRKEMRLELYQLTIRFWFLQQVVQRNIAAQQKGRNYLRCQLVDLSCVCQQRVITGGGFQFTRCSSRCWCLMMEKILPKIDSFVSIICIFQTESHVKLFEKLFDCDSVSFCASNRIKRDVKMIFFLLNGIRLSKKAIYIE